MPAEGNNKRPDHVVIIMDGNGRWAVQQGLPRAAGHKAGVKALRNIVEECARREISVLTVFAFSSENWRRPKQEVGFLLDLFVNSLHEQVDDLHKNDVRLRFIGDRTAFPEKLQHMIKESEEKTAANPGLTLVVAANYGGRWDIVDACKRIAGDVKNGRVGVDAIDEGLFSQYLSLSGYPQPDLFIRTGGEQRLSNYLLWQCAYAELYFCDELWPEFTSASLDRALDWYRGRQRRFGAIRDGEENA